MLFAVFLVAVMMISLTTAALKIETQGQREREEEMVWRGHQYERGIRRYVAKFGHYPTKIDDMVKATSGVRYMREAYKDPMNKEDGTWRFIYVTPAGALIGSVRYTSLIQMALMDKMAQFGGAGMPGMAGMPGVARRIKPIRQLHRVRRLKRFRQSRFLRIRPARQQTTGRGSGLFAAESESVGRSGELGQQQRQRHQQHRQQQRPGQSAHGPESSGRRKLVGVRRRRPAFAKR